jgi:predicted Zn-dependent protease
LSWKPLPFFHICDTMTSEILEKMQGEYVEVRHSTVIWNDLKTQLGNQIQREYKEGVSLRLVDKGCLKSAHSPDFESIVHLVHQADSHPVMNYTPAEVAKHHEEQPEPVDLPIELVQTVLNRFSTFESAGARLESLITYEHISTNLGTDIYCGTSKLFIRLFLTPQEGITLVYSFGYPGEDVIKKLEQVEQLELNKFSECHSIPSGPYTVVFSPQVTGMIFHEIAHSFEGDVPQFPEIPAFISVSDHPEAERLGGYAYDSEGTKASPTVLIDHGVPSHCLTSVFQPGDRTLTGNGRASSFDVSPIPRQSNLEVNADTTSTEEELLEMAGDGIYIAQVGEGSTFPGNITYFTNTVCYRIEKGELKEPLKGISFGGNLTDMVKSIQYMGGIPKVEPTVCWKNKQRLFMTTTAPSSFVKDIPLSCHSSPRKRQRAW